jgi:HicA toxin of bacterial toxin-antitoxin,
VAKLPIDLSGREVRAALERAGFVFRRQSGSHISPPPRTSCQGPSYPTTSRFERAPSAASSPMPA